MFVRGTEIVAAELLSTDTVEFASMDRASVQAAKAAIHLALEGMVSRCDDAVLVVEGAGSPVDAHEDLANGFVADCLAEWAPRIVLTSYSWNGGACASVLGTFNSLPARLRERTIGFVQSSPRSFDAARRWNELLSQATGLRPLGIIPRVEIRQDATSDLDLVIDAFADVVARAVDIESLIAPR
jgi:cobyric acid synthase